MQQVARNTEGPLADEFSRVLREMQIGQGRGDALRAMADRTNLPDLRSFVSAMVQADSFGIPIAQVLRVQSQEMRVKRRQRAEEKAQQVPVKITIPLIFFILPCLFIAVMGPAALSIIDNLSALAVPESLRRASIGARAFAAVALAVPLALNPERDGLIALAILVVAWAFACLDPLPTTVLRTVLEAAVVGTCCAFALQDAPLVLAALVVVPFVAGLGTRPVGRLRGPVDRAGDRRRVLPGRRSR